MIEPIISIPTPDNYTKEVSGENLDYGFGFFEMQGERSTQEDALAWRLIDKSDLHELPAKEIGKRLWTTYHILDQEAASLQGGTTASTIVFDGENLITASVGDAAAFGVAYQEDGRVIGVVRLNHRVHKPSDEEEMARLRKAGSKIHEGRVENFFAMSRAIGDYEVMYIRRTIINKAAMTADADIDIINIKNDLAIPPDAIVKLQIIVTCDGFTDGAGLHQQTKKGHEDYLRSCLESYQGNTAGNASEKNIAQYLAEKAAADIEQYRKDYRNPAIKIDNISIAVQTLGHNAVMVGVYDGHNGSAVSSHVASNIGRVFLEQCALTPKHYEKQKFSVSENPEAYLRDNCHKTQEQTPSTRVFTSMEYLTPLSPHARRPRAVSIFKREPLPVHETVEEPSIDSLYERFKDF